RKRADWLVPNSVDSYGWFRDRLGVDHRMYFYDFYATREIGSYERRRLAITRATLAPGLDLCRPSGARLVVFYVPMKFRVYGDSCTFPPGSRCRTWHPWDLESLVAALCKDAGLEFVSLTDPLRQAAMRGELVYLTDDSHWNAAGQAVA